MGLELIHDTQFLLRCCSSEDNLLVSTQLRPLMIVERDKFGSAKHNGLADVSTFWRLRIIKDWFLIQRYTFGVPRKRAHTVNEIGCCSYDSAFNGNGLGRYFEITSHHKNTDASSSESSHDFGNLISWRVDYTNKTNQG